MSSQINIQEPFKRITAEEAKALMEQGGVHLIDVREPMENAQVRLVQRAQAEGQWSGPVHPRACVLVDEAAMQHLLQQARGGALRHAEPPRDLIHAQFRSLCREPLQDVDSRGQRAHLFHRVEHWSG